jgi:hypothetical protein
MHYTIYIVGFLSAIWAARGLVNLPITLSVADENVLSIAYENAIQLGGLTRVNLHTQMRQLECKPCSRCSDPSRDVRMFCDGTDLVVSVAWVCTAQIPDGFNLTRSSILLTDYESLENNTGKRPFSAIAKGHCTFDYTVVAETDSSLPIYTADCEDPVDPVYLSTNGRLIPGGVCDPFYYERLANLYEEITPQQRTDAITKCCQYNYKYFRDGDQRYRICQ